MHQEIHFLLIQEEVFGISLSYTQCILKRKLWKSQSWKQRPLKPKWGPESGVNSTLSALLFFTIEKKNALSMVQNTYVNIQVHIQRYILQTFKHSGGLAARLSTCPIVNGHLDNMGPHSYFYGYVHACEREKKLNTTPSLATHC